MTDPPSGLRTTIFRDRGLIVVFLITMTYVGIVFLTPGSPVRIPLGVVELLFAPGYALGTILFLRRPLLPPLAEFSVAVGLSVVFNVLVGLLLSLFGLGLAVDWLVIADTVVVWAGVMVRVIGESEPGVTGVSGPIRRQFRLPGVRASYRMPVYTLLVASVVAFAGVVYVSVAQPPTPATTSLALYGPDGTASSLPANLSVGVVGLVVLTVADGSVNGPIVLTLTTTLLGSSTNLTTVPWTQPLNLTSGTTSSLPLTIGTGQQISLTLTFQFLQPGDYAVTFSLEGTGGALLQSAILGVMVGT